MITHTIKSNKNALLLTAFLIGLFILTYLPVWKELVTAWLNSED
jgi:hypothetical protein